ncbi:electron transfer flavoprotein subunit beta/FixA family protein [Actinotalea solisilvae]|uniref:electron transfer flavoprotein subunit beta/FixA family protein n=1 Tax=Actinotalea solisilvae TaxID=2072922 RepID=UPI0018F1C0A9|nr:electron transfer flavoprotein subunit beta/FixA family protein [Actinotalea solisilvae]
MRIIVCVKHVPDPQSDRSFTEDGHLDRTAGDGSMNEMDEYAVEAALALADARGARVTAVTMGPPEAEDAVRRALQMGADDAVLVTDPALAGSDLFSTAAVLGAVVTKLAAEEPVDLVLTGTVALDALSGVMPALLAAELALPCLTLATEVALVNSSVRIKREGETVEILEAPLPAVVSVTDRANSPRFPDFRRIVAARKKPVTTWSLADLPLDPSAVGAAAARTHVVAAAARPPRTAALLLADDGTAGAVLADYLIKNGLA